MSIQEVRNHNLAVLRRFPTKRKQFSDPDVKYRHLVEPAYEKICNEAHAWFKRKEIYIKKSDACYRRQRNLKD